jgi:hypothetical protein
MANMSKANKFEKILLEVSGGISDVPLSFIRDHILFTEKEKNDIKGMTSVNNPNLGYNGTAIE